MKALILSLIFLLSCSSLNESPKNSPSKKLSFSLKLNTGKALKKDGLKAEYAVYTDSTVPKVVVMPTEVDLIEKDGKLSIKDLRIKVKAGSYLVRVYLSHVGKKALLWVGEWLFEVKAGETVSVPRSKKTIKSNQSESDLKGDVHEFVKDKKEIFGEAGKNNLDQVCQKNQSSCGGENKDKLRTCNAEGFGYKEEKDCLKLLKNSKSTSCETDQCKIKECQDNYKQQDGKIE